MPLMVFAVSVGYLKILYYYKSLLIHPETNGDIITDRIFPKEYDTYINNREVSYMRLKDKVAIITGGSRGIGYATADAFLREGATVILAASSQESADKAVESLKEKYPDRTVAGISPDLSSLESVRNEFREATAKYGCVDILVNNAGVSERTPFVEYTEEAFDKVMDLNVKGVFNATRAASECMIARGSGVILSTSSMVSLYGQPSGIAYPASKFAVNGLTVSLARELGPKGNPASMQWRRELRKQNRLKAVPKERDRAYDRTDSPSKAGTARKILPMHLCFLHQMRPLILQA